MIINNIKIKVFRNKNKILTISIVDDSIIEETEEEVKQKQIAHEISNIQSAYSPTFLCSAQKQSLERKKLLTKNNSYLNQLLAYMESENYISDISFKRVSENNYIKELSESIFINRENLGHARNFQGEYNLLKIITDGEDHKNNQIALEKSLKRNNRYSDMLPYQYNIVPFQLQNTFTSENQHDWYINASYINGPFKSDEKMFVATQGPLKSTIGKFYKMCFNNDVKLIIMLCSFEEEGRKKCERYLPERVNEETQYDNDIKVILQKEEWVIMNCLIKREIIITINGISKQMFHLQMINWPDYSMPNAENGYDTIDYLIRAIAESRENYPNSPVLLHCSAGTGRTGTLIAIFNLIKCLSFFNSVNFDRDIHPFFSVFNMVRRLREQRRGMVSSVEQYTFIYQFLLCWIKRNVDLG